MRELELRSDAIAVLTLERVGIDPERLAAAVQKQTRYNQVRDAAGRDNGNGEDSQSFAERYVPLKDRVAFIRTVAQLAWADRPVSSAARVEPEP